MAQKKNLPALIKAHGFKYCDPSTGIWDTFDHVHVASLEEGYLWTEDEGEGFGVSGIVDSVEYPEDYTKQHIMIRFSYMD